MPWQPGMGEGRTTGLAALDSKAMKRAMKVADVVLVRGGCPLVNPHMCCGAELAATVQTNNL